MKNSFLLLLVLVFLTTPAMNIRRGILEKDGLTLTPVTDSPKFPRAVLQMQAPADASVSDQTAVEFRYKLKNYELSVQTSDAADKHCSNSNKGQHIHLILNNEPYLAKYETKFTETLKEGNYVALSFLSRSYHESLKHSKAYQLIQFSVGKGEYKKTDLKKPMLFYSRPKGEYKGEDTKKVLLDFYIVNCKLSPNDYKVKATINGTEFTLTDWQAYAMVGLPMGENTIRLQLLDKDNKPAQGDFTSVERKITLTP